MNLLECEPASVFKIFRQISDIPRESDNEAQICNYLVDFAKTHGLEYYRDDSNNVIIKKPASSGYEDFPTVILQAHMDMVCVKREESNHNFFADPIDIIVDGDFIRAKDTSLGADDGIGLAIALAVLEENLPSPNLEIVATTAEEIGLVGAQALDKSQLSGNILINLDNSTFGQLCVGSAGALRIKISMPLEFESSEGDEIFSLKISGLLSGHSGDEINCERANAIILLARVLNEIKDDIFLFDISGGTKMNLIPNIAYANFSVRKENVPQIKYLVDQMQDAFSKEFAETDKNVKISLESVNENVGHKKCLSQASLKNLISRILLTPNGIINMCLEMDDLPNTSNNLGVIELSNDRAFFYVMVRSMTSSRKYLTADIIKLLFADSDIEILTDIPAWDFDSDSKLNEYLADVYENIFGNAPQIMAIHGGLECNCFADKVKNLVSIGADIFNLHTVNEHCNIKSVQKLWKFVCTVLQDARLKNLA